MSTHASALQKTSRHSSSPSKPRNNASSAMATGIYKTEDPQSKLTLGMIHATFEEKEEAGTQRGQKREEESSSQLLQIALEIARAAGSDSYFVSRRLRANADLDGALLYTALGFEADFVVALACVSRVGGAMAHWREAMQETPVL